MYGKEKTGDFSIRFAAGAGVLFDNTIEVPAEYTPGASLGAARAAARRREPADGAERRRRRGSRRGGVVRQAAAARPASAAGGVRIASPANRRFTCFPSGSADAAWWHGHQVDNILRLVDRLKRRYNVDESRIYLTGISDGGTGVYYMGDEGSDGVVGIPAA